MRIGVYAGSFNPFHTGHLDILNKAEKMFDKIVIVRAVNPDKEASSWPMPESLKDRTIVIDEATAITEVVQSLKGNAAPENDVAIIRGLRNSHDLQAEMNYYYVLQDIMPDIKVVSILCDRNLQHVSSTLVRGLKKLRNVDYKQYLVE